LLQSLDGCELTVDVAAIVDKFSGLMLQLLKHSLAQSVWKRPANDVWPIVASSCAQWALLQELLGAILGQQWMRLLALQ